MFYKLNDDKTVSKVDIKDISDKVSNILFKDIIGDSTVSTVFLWIDHNFSGGQPVLFETMIFGGKYDGEQFRYQNYENAASGHKFLVYLLEQETHSE